MAYRYEFEPDQCWYKNACEFAKTEHCNQACERYLEMHFLVSSSGIPSGRMNNLVLQPDTPEDRDAFLYLRDLKTDVESFVKNGENLYLFSRNLGNGKTTWSIKIMLSYFNKVWLGNGFVERGLFIHTPTLLAELKNAIANPNPDLQHRVDLLRYVDLVIWDDIAAGKLSDYDHTTLLTYIDQRTIENKSNIYTGNVGGDDLVKYIGRRLTSRVWNQSEIVELNGNDKRRPHAYG